jgi:transposase
MTEVACWAHVRRKIHDVHLATKAPIAAEALEHIGRLFDVEPEVTGLAPAARRQIRQARARPVIDDLAAFLDGSLPKLSGKGELAGAMRYARGRWEALARYLDDGRLEISNNAAERAIRPLAMRGSLCTPSSSIWEHWKCVRVSSATRATFSGHRYFDRLRRQVTSADLVGRSGNNLLSRKDAGFNEAA